MAKIARGKVDGFLRNPGGDLKAALIHGPDRGLCRERAETLAKSVCPDLNDPFRVARLSEEELKTDPRRLSDEVSALAMTGGRRVVIAEADGEPVGRLVAGIAETPDWDALLIVVAGNLTPRAALRKALEPSAAAAVIACYADDDASLGRLIDEVFQTRKVTASREVKAFVAGSLGGDRLASRGELEKLALFAGEGGELGLEDAAQALGDGAALSIDDLVHAAASGDFNGLERQLRRARDDGLAPVSILRAVQRHFQRLQLTRVQMDQGKSPSDAMKSLRPPVMFMFADRFRRQLTHWSPAGIARAMDLAVEAELDCKSAGLPAAAVCERAMMRIAHAAGRGRTAAT